MKKANHKWFWATFLVWCLISSVGAWALIFSPFHPNAKEVAAFNAEINGQPVTSHLLVIAAQMDSCLESLTRQWQSQGWKTVSGNINLASVLLRVPADCQSALNSLVQVKMFEKEDVYRLLGLWEDFEGGQTYQWITEMPKKVLAAPAPGSFAFPIQPPKNAKTPALITTGKTELLVWGLPSSPNPDQELTHLYTSQGFSGRLWSRRSGESVFLLQRGTLRLFAVVVGGDSVDSFSLAKISKNE